MRFQPLLALLSATALSSAEDSSSSSSSASASSTPPIEEPTPMGALWTANWTDADLKPYTQHCRSTTTITANIYALANLYPDLEKFAPELKVFYHKQHYPGTWEGVDEHGTKRELLKMEYEKLPFGVREWLNKTKQRRFSVQEEYVFFAPGAIYPILPLWVDEPEGAEMGECEGVFEDLENYSNDPKDGAVIGKVSHKSLGEKEVEFTIEAMQVKKKDGSGRDEL